MVEDYKDLTILLPAYNEAQGVGLVIDDIRKYLPEASIWIEDGGSTDKTLEVISQRGVVCHEGKWKGKGEAIAFALKEIQTTYLVMIDSDNTYPVHHIPTIYSMLKNGSDVVLGYRHFKASGSMPLINALGNSALSILASLLYFKPIQDVCTGMWGFRDSFYKGLVIQSKGFTLEAEFFTKAVKTRQRISEYPISYRKRQEGSLPKLRLLDGLKIAWYLIKESAFVHY